jgi:hypothetical protein
VVRIPERTPSNSEPATFNPWGTEAYLIESFRDRRDQIAKLSVYVEENSTSSDARSVTIFDPDVGVSFRSHIRVTRGILDRLHLEVPADWIGPLDISPPARVVEQGDAAEGRRRMQIQLVEPVPAGQAFELRFNGSIAAPQDGSWIVPVLRLLGPSSNSSFVVVPSDGTRPVESWTLEGAIPSELPLALARGIDLPPEAQAFQILPDRQHDYSIRLSPAAQEAPPAALALADVYVYIDEGGAQMHRTQFLLPPFANAMLTIEWPPGHEPVATYLENRQLRPNPVDGSHWQVPIGPTDLPIILTTVTRVSASAARSLQLNRPRLWDRESEYSLQLTLWSVATPRSLHLVGAPPHSSTTVGELTFLRLARMTQLIVAAEPHLSSLSPSDRNAWTQLWTERLRAESVALEQSGELAEAKQNQSTVRAEDDRTREQLITQLNQLLSRIMPTGESADFHTNPRDALVGPFMWAPVKAVQQSSFIVGGPQSSLELQLAADKQATTLPQAAITLAIVAAVGVLLRQMTSIDPARLLASHPRRLVVALGVICLLIVPLPAIGLAFIAAALISWVAERWLGRRSSASTL